MSVAKNEFASLISRIRAGSLEAAWDLTERYGPHVHRVVRRVLDSRLRSQFDSADFVQSMWGSFFRHPSQIRSFQTPDDLIRYLVSIARNKVIDRYNSAFKTQKRNLGRTTSLRDSAVKDEALLDRSQPSPLEFAMARERWDRLFANQPLHYQKILQLRIMGNSYVEIADQLKMSERNVRRVIGRLVSMED